MMNNQLDKYIGLKFIGGKYRGELVCEIIKKNPRYVEWVEINAPDVLPPLVKFDGRKLSKEQKDERKGKFKIRAGRYRGMTIDELEKVDFEYLEYLKQKDSYLLKEPRYTVRNYLQSLKTLYSVKFLGYEKYNNNYKLSFIDCDEKNTISVGKREYKNHNVFMHSRNKNIISFLERNSEKIFYVDCINKFNSYVFIEVRWVISVTRSTGPLGVDYENNYITVR